MPTALTRPASTPASSKSSRFNVVIDPACEQALDAETLERWMTVTLPQMGERMAIGEVAELTRKGVTYFLHRAAHEILRLVMEPGADVWEAMPKPKHAMNPALGRELWGLIHRGAPMPEERTAIVAEVLRRLPCGQCKRHAREWIVAHPPRVESAVAFAVWGWRFHDDTNERIGKPRVTLEEALVMWGV